jgi:hypothetical protein
MKCYSCGQAIEAHPNYPTCKVWHNAGTDPPIIHKCPPKEKVITNGRWVGFTVKEANAISLNQERIHSAYLASLREKFRSPWIKD